MLSQQGCEDFDDAEYEAEDLDTEEIANLSAGAIGASVLDQLKGEIEPTKNPTNFLATLDQRVKYLISLHSDDDSSIIKIRSSELEFYATVAGEIANHLGVSIDGLDLEPTIPTVYKRKIRALYNFLIINRFSNILSIYYTYIINHRKEIAKELKTTTDKKDLTISNMRKQIKSFDDISILYNISEIIDELSREEMKMDEFIDLLVTADGDSVDTYLAAECLAGCDIAQPLKTYSESVVDNDNMRAALESELLFHLNSTFERK
jgi:ribosome recycling factor